MKTTNHRCKCGWTGQSPELLTARHPFDSTKTVHACPQCRQMDRIQRTCDHPGCNARPQFFTPDGNGGESLTCFRHRWMPTHYLGTARTIEFSHVIQSA